MALSLLTLKVLKRPFEARWVTRKAHWVQLLMHSAVFIYWSRYDPLVVDVAPLILAQLPLAYLLDMTLAWSRNRVWSAGLGPLPIVGSVNLFLWFKPEHYHWQLAMIALAFMGRELLQWERGGRRRHIFNPSGLALTLASLALIIGDGSREMTWGQEIATHLQLAPYMFELIFGLGVIVQLAFGVVWTTLSAALTLWGLEALWSWSYGEWFFTDTVIPISVFLGMNLLITDPATSPKSALGKALFGALYGLCVMPLFMLLGALGQPTFFDKLLQVPLCNLLAPRLDQLAARLNAWGGARAAQLSLGSRPAVLLWGLCFVALRPSLVSHPGLEPESWMSRCEAGESYACRGLWHSLEKGCGLLKNERCLQLAMRLADPEALNRDLDRALQLLNLSCQRGHEESCQRKRELLTPPELEAAELPEPAALERSFSEACERGSAPGCANLGLMHLQGQARAPSPQRARELHEKACALKLAQACGRLAVLYARGIGGEPDPQRAQEASKRACELGDGVSCLALKGSR